MRTSPFATAVSAPRYLSDIRELAPSDAEWPSGTAALGADAPEALWARGESLLATMSPVLVTGCRASTAYGERVATDLAAQLAAAGCTVLNGGAYGIDAAATRGALAAGGNVVLALAGGVDEPYPRAHGALFDEVLRRGTLLSAYAPGEHPTRARFIERNHLLAAMARAVVVVEAANRSGALVCVHKANEWGKPAMAVPGPVTSVTSQASHQLIRDGRALLVSDASQILDVLAQEGATHV